MLFHTARGIRIILGYVLPGFLSPETDHGVDVLSPTLVTGRPRSPSPDRNALGGRNASTISAWAASMDLEEDRPYSLAHYKLSSLRRGITVSPLRRSPRVWEDLCALGVPSESSMPIITGSIGSRQGDEGCIATSPTVATPSEVTTPTSSGPPSLEASTSSLASSRVRPSTPTSLASLQSKRSSTKSRPRFTIGPDESPIFPQIEHRRALEATIRHLAATGYGNDMLPGSPEYETVERDAFRLADGKLAEIKEQQQRDDRVRAVWEKKRGAEQASEKNGANPKRNLRFEPTDHLQALDDRFTALAQPGWSKLMPHPDSRQFRTVQRHARKVTKAERKRQADLAKRAVADK